MRLIVSSWDQAIDARFETFLQLAQSVLWIFIMYLSAIYGLFIWEVVSFIFYLLPKIFIFTFAIARVPLLNLTGTGQDTS